MRPGENVYCGLTTDHASHFWWGNNSMYHCPGITEYVVSGTAPGGDAPRRDPKDMVAGPYGPTFPKENKEMKEYAPGETYLKGKGYQEPDPNDPGNYERAAGRFLADCGLPLVPDAISQLEEAFLPALRIICERGYHPEGNTWREAGWRGLLTDIRKKANRLWYRSWIKGGFDDDSAMDLINFCAFYYRLGNRGREWGDWGDPGQKTDRRYPLPGKESEAAKAKEHLTVPERLPGEE